jgi:hypothetical protein
MRDPDPGARAHDRLQGCHETTGGMEYLHATTGGVLVNIWFPVRHNDDALAVEVAAERVDQRRGVIGREKFDRMRFKCVEDGGHFASLSLFLQQIQNIPMPHMQTIIVAHGNC